MATADARTLATARAARLGVNRSTASASSTSLPLIRAITGRTFVGEIRTYRATAFASIACPPPYAGAAGGEAGAGAAPPPPAGTAGRTDVVRSTLAPWLLNVRVGANSPSL